MKKICLCEGLKNGKKLPEGWEWKKLGDITTNYDGKRVPLKKEERKDVKGIYPYYGASGIIDYVNDYLFDGEYLLVGEDGANLIARSTPIAFKATGKFWANNHAHILKTSEDVSLSYLMYYINNIDLKKYVTGTAQPKLTQQSMNRIVVPVPRLEIQQKIVSILEKAEETKKLRAQTDELMQELLQSVFLGMFGDITENPKKWNMKKIGDIAEIKTGGTPSRNNEEYWQNGTLSWVKTTEIKENVIYETEELITESGFQNSNATLIPQNSILIAMYGQGKTRGKTAKLGIQSTTNQACAAILPSDRYESDFLWTFLRLSYETLRSFGRGGNQPNLNLSMIKDFKIYLPPIENQKRFSEIFNLIEKSKQHQQQSFLEINNLFDALMQKAFTGELVS